MPTASNTARLATLVLTAAYLAVSLPAEARITKLVLSTVQSPTFGGTFFGTIGPYEKLAGRAFGEIDPSDPLNATITDLASAPRNAAGKVEYSMDVYLLKPVDMAQASGKLFYESNNRGLKLATGVINTVDRLFLSNDPTTPADAGDGFLMRQGYVIAWSGWDVTVASGPGALTITVPVAANGDGIPIVGPSLEEFVVDATTATNRLSYAAATTDTSAATLSVRVHYADPPVAISPDGWEYVDSRTVRLLPAGTLFQQGHLYDLAYPARDRWSRGSRSRRRVTSSRSCAARRPTMPARPIPSRAGCSSHTASGSRSRRASCATSSISASTRTRAAAWSSTGCSTSWPVRAADPSIIASHSPAAPSASTAIGCIRRSASRSPGASRPIP